MKIYDLIKSLLTERPELRDSDRKLVWAVWYEQGLADKNYITKDNFMEAEHMETIRRTRQKIQERFPHLRSSNPVQIEKDRKRRTKGMFVFHHGTPIFDNLTNTVRFK